MSHKAIACLDLALEALHYYDSTAKKAIPRNPDTGWHCDELCEAYSFLLNMLLTAEQRKVEPGQPPWERIGSPWAGQ